MKNKCVVMLSGGLDSRLAVKIMQERGFDVIVLYFKLPFSKDAEKEVKDFCKKEKVKLEIFDCTRLSQARSASSESRIKGKLFQEYLNVIRNPKYGRGTAMNPCIDCRIFILKKAKKFADSEGINFIATGEVVGERPMSQHKKALEIVEKESGLKERLIRPLCEIGICGRSRKKQIELAGKFGISYPQPAGGCLLCEREYCEKLKKVLDKKMDFDDIRLLNIGRHFENSNIILGRNEKENELLEKDAKNFSTKNFGATKSKDFVGKGIKIIPKQPGATALVKSRKFEKKAKELIQKYSKHKILGFEVER